MKNLSSWLIAFFIIIFWLFRVVVAMMGSMNFNFMIEPIDNNIEIILLFVVLALVPFIFKRKTWAAIVYFIAYAWYFGRDLINNLMLIMDGNILSAQTYMNMFVELIAIVLPIVANFDIMLDRARTKNPINKETDWFYKNEQYDRKLDERADKNHYKII